MSAMDMLKAYVERPIDTHQDFDDVSRQMPTGALGAGQRRCFPG